MFCRFCGAENEDHAVFCKKCGKSLGAEPPVEQPTAVIPANPAAAPAPSEPAPAGQVPAEPPAPIAWEGPLSCPYCRAGGGHCHPVVKTDVKTSGGGYGFWSGCCGLILLGPPGLLCGACGRSVKTKVRNDTWWVCDQCGKEFLSKQSALAQASLSMRSAALYSLLLTSGMFYGMSQPDGSIWMFLIFSLIVVGLWFSIPKTMAETTGLAPDQLLTPEEYAAFRLKLWAFCVLSIVLGALWGASVNG